jgi:hypothetical protein
MANFMLETDEGPPGFWRELGAAIISPPTGFNRLVFGHRFDSVYPSHRPATFLRLEAGGTLTSSSRNVSSSVNEHGAVGELTFTYGLPGKPGYGYTRPFDYFDFHVSAATANTLETITSRGFLLGKAYAAGDTTTRNLGPVRQLRLYLAVGVPGVQHRPLPGNRLAVVAVGGHRSPRHPAGRCRVWRGRQHPAHGGTGLPYGTTPQALVALRLIYANRAMFDVTGREYHVSSFLSPERHGQEHIIRVESALTLRVFDRHGVALRYTLSHRDAHFPSVDYRNQTVGAVSLMYVLLGNSGFGAVEWR